MSFHLIAKNSLPASASPYRLLDPRGHEVRWANQFLDAQKLRQLSLRSLRVYAYDLLHLARWCKNTRHSLGKLNQSLLLEYVRDQLKQQPSPTPQTINHRLCVLHCLYRSPFAPRLLAQVPQQVQLLIELLGAAACSGLGNFLQPLATMASVVNVPAGTGDRPATIQSF